MLDFDGIFHAFLELVVFILAAWTLAYQVVLFWRIPAIYTIPGFVILSSIIAFTLRFRTDQKIRVNGQDSTSIPIVIGIVVIGLLVGALTLVISFTDWDDFLIYRRALVQLSHLYEPIFTTNTIFDIAGLPQISYLHKITSYELLTAFTAHFIGLDPYWFLQHVNHFIAAFVFTIVMFLLYRSMEFSSLSALLAVLCCIIFLLFDCTHHRSIGVTFFARLWHGRSIIFAVFLPLGLYLALQYLEKGGARRWLFVFLYGIASIGLSNVAIFLLPIQLVATGIGHFYANKSRIKDIKRYPMLLLAAAYPVAIGAYFAFSPFEKMVIDNWQDGHWPNVWYLNIYGKMLMSHWNFYKKLILLIIFPFFIKNKKWRNFLLAYHGSIGLLAINPITGPIIIKIIMPASYWRIMYLLMLPLLSGLAALVFVRRAGLRCRIFHIWALALLILATSQIEETSIFQHDDIKVKRIRDYKYLEKEQLFSRKAARFLGAGDIILANRNIVCILDLLAVDSKFLVSDCRNTWHIFKNARRQQEGKFRIAAQRILEKPIRIRKPGYKEMLPKIKALIESKVTAIIMPLERYEMFKDIFELNPTTWHEVINEFGYIMIKKYNR